MVRRWIIRIVFMMPILLCVGGWGWSGMYHSSASYSHDGHWVGCGSGWGVVTVSLGRWSGTPDGWECDDAYKQDDFILEPPDTPDSHYFLGFRRLNHGLETPAYWYDFTVPYWFLIAMFSAVLFLVWRKTRPKIYRGGAFPVEMA